MPGTGYQQIIDAIEAAAVHYEKVRAPQGAENEVSEKYLS
jgi:hypothetical protein